MDATLLRTLQESKKIVKVRSWNLPISRKNSVHVAKAIRYLPLNKAKQYLKDVINQKVAVPYFRYNRDVGHKASLKGAVPMGRYPKKVSEYFLKLLNSLEKNAINLGFDPEKLVLLHINVHKGTTIYGRNRKWRVRKKRTHVEMYALYIEELDTKKYRSKKAIQKLIKSILKKNK